MVIGLAISLFQSVTSIQEQTLTFVPKALGIVGLLVAADAVDAALPDRIHHRHHPENAANGPMTQCGYHSVTNPNREVNMPELTNWMMVFLRVSAMLAVFPVFSAANFPVQLRLALGALMAVLDQPDLAADAVDARTLVGLGRPDGHGSGRGPAARLCQPDDFFRPGYGGRDHLRRKSACSCRRHQSDERRPDRSRRD